MFESVETTCLACQKSGISACVKRWGPLKESTERADGNPGFVNDPAVQKTQLSPHEPSRQIPTAIGALISGEECNLLEYIYTLSDKPRASSTWQHLYKRLIFKYGLSIECPSVRFGLLAYSAATQFYRGICGNQDRIDDYSFRGCRALRNKVCEEFNVEEMFTMLLLICAEKMRYYYYVGASRSNPDLLRGKARLTVHMRGMHSFLESFGDRLRVTTTESFGKEVWDFVVNSFGSSISIAYTNGMDVINLSSFYRQRIPEIQDCHQLAIPFRDSALGNTVAGLVKMLLEGCMDGTKDLYRISLEQELEGYLSLCGLIGLPPMMISETQGGAKWWGEQVRIMQYYAGRIILHLSKELVVPFTWVQEVVAAALRIDKAPPRRDSDMKFEQNLAVIYVLKAALVIPPANDFACNFPVSDF